MRWALILLATSCSYSFGNPPAFRCGPDDSCPHGQVCGISGMCESDRQSIDASPENDADCSAQVCCVNHADCPSKICDRGAGSCVPLEDVTHVAHPGKPDDCGSTERPCESITLALATRPRWVLIDGGIYDEELLIDGFEVTMVGAAPALVVLTSAQGNVIVVQEGARLELHDLSITAIAVADQSAILCASSQLHLDHVDIASVSKIGVTAQLCDVVNIRNSRILGAAGGGIVLQRAANATIVNNVIANSGGGLLTSGGLFISTLLGAAGSVLVAHNTLMNNGSDPGVASGIDCSIAAFTGFYASSNIIHGNGGLAVNDGDCQHRYSSIENDTSGEPTNNSIAPIFDDPETFTLAADATCCVDKAEPGLGITPDRLGTPRPADAPDIGAYERVSQ